MYSSTGVVRRRCKKRRSAVDDIVDLTKRRAAAKVFKVHSCACKSKSREPNHATLRVMINNPFGLFVTLDIVSLCTNLIALASAISEIYMG